MRKPLWVNNSERTRPNAGLCFEIASDPNRLKALAEKRMKWYDDLPKDARQAVGEYGQLKAAAKAHYIGANPVYACRNAYKRLLELTSVKLED